MSEGVFGNTAEAELWKRISKADGIKNTDRRLKEIKYVLNKVILSDEKHDSRSLCRLIDIVADEEAQGWTDDVRDLVARSCPQDCHPALEAALRLARKGLFADAERYLDMLGDAPDKARYYLVKAQVDLSKENTRDAIGDLNLALCSDKTLHEAYQMLKKIDPRVNWGAVEACELMARGESFDEPEDDGAPELQLYRIYREWYRGNRETATRMLVSSPQYNDKVPAYCILSARMSRDEGDWHSCQMMLEDACGSVENDVSLLCELGDAYLRGGNYDHALSSYRNAEAFDMANPAVVKGMIKACMALGKNSEALQSISEFLDSEMATYDDFEEFAWGLLTMGFYSEASEYALKITYSNPGDARACIILSKVAMNDGKYREAESYAEKGAKANKKNASSLAQLSTVYLTLRRTSKAASLAKKAVAADKQNLDALLAMMAVYKETGENERAIETCRNILEIDPRNKIASETLSTLELASALKSKNVSEDMPAVVGEQEFVTLIERLIAEGKYTEAVRLCTDNDSRFGASKDVRFLRGNAEYALGEYLKASASYASAAVLMKNNAEVWHSKGLADEKAGDFDSAEEAFGKAVLLDMNNAEYWISMGCVKEKKGDLDAAVKAFNRAIELDPRSSYALVRKAAILASGGLYSEALNFLDLAEATDPKNTNIQTVKMKVCVKATKYIDAVNIGKKLMKKDPDASTVATYARANIALNDLGLAKKVLDKALASEPDSYDLLTAYRDLCVKTADTDETIKVCNEILKLDPYDKTTKKPLADALMRSGRSDEANLIYGSIRNEDDTSKEIPASEEDPAARFAVAKSMFEAGDLTSAARLTDIALKADPDNIDYALFRAAIYRKSGDKRVADMFLTQYLERNPTNGFLHEAVGDMRSEDGDFKGAAASYAKAISSGVKKSSIYVKLGDMQEKMGGYANAVKSYTTAVMLDPHDADANRSLAYVQFKTHDTDAALRSIQASIASEPSREAYAIMAMIYQSKKDRAGVREAYQGFLRFDSTGDEWTRSVITALNSVGLRTEANLLSSRQGTEEEARDGDVPPEIKRCAERILRRAYLMDADVTDPGIADGVGADTNIVQNALAFIADVPAYGDVLFGTNESDRMEDLSYHTVQRARNKDLGALTVETAFVAGGAKDVDEAKLLTAYVRSALVSKLPREIPEKFVELGAGTDRNMTIEEVMVKYRIGVFSARMVLANTKDRDRFLRGEKPILILYSRITIGKDIKGGPVGLRNCRK